jgi:hypothetical protein
MDFHYMRHENALPLVRPLVDGSSVAVACNRLTFVIKGLAAVAVAVGIFFAARSAHLGYTLLRPDQFRDQLFSVDQYARWRDGHYRFSELWAFHNEHRILTSRLLYLIDGLYFDFSNRFLIASIYAGLLMLTVASAALALKARTSSRVAIGTLALLGIGWSDAQSETLTMGFQTQFILAHLFALGCFFCIVRISAAGASRPLAWLALAIAADGLGMLSGATGVMIGVAAIAVCLMFQPPNRFVAAFALFHAAAAAAYFVGMPDHPGAHGAAVVDMVRYFLRCLGDIARAQQPHHAPVLLGLAMLSIGIFFCVRCWRKGADRSQMILLAVVLFVLAETAATAAGRAGLGADQALSSRYATQSAVLAMALLALCWRSLPTEMGRCATMIATIAVTLLANGEQNILEVEESIGARDSAMFSFINGVHAPSQMEFIFPDVPTVERVYQKLAELRKGPFALSAAVYRPPLNAVALLDRAKLPTCRSSIDTTSSRESWTEISGWIDAHGWIMAFTDDGRLVGYTTSSIRRPDVASSLSLPQDRVGFDLFLNNRRIAGERLHLIAVTDAPATPCVFSRRFANTAARTGRGE